MKSLLASLSARFGAHLGRLRARLARMPRWRRSFIYALSTVFFLIFADAVYVIAVCPDWSDIAKGGWPQSRFIESYRERREENPRLAALRWQPVPLRQIPTHLRRTVIIAEDARFYQHSGFDPSAIEAAMRYAFEHGKIGFGASTISQQTIKNLVVGGSRTPWRKWHELLLSLWMEQRLNKSRILSLYLNIVELGPGIYGVQSAARSYWNKDASALTVNEGIELAASLPSPRRHNPRTRTSAFLRRVDKIRRHLEAYEGL